jgi:hypothetical protein
MNDSRKREWKNQKEPKKRNSRIYDELSGSRYDNNYCYQITRNIVSS